MAHWFRKGKKGQVYVLVMKDGKAVPLKRSITSYLDGFEDHHVAREVEQRLAPQYEGEKKVTPQNLLADDSELGALVKAYVAFLRSRKKDPNTVGWHEDMLRSHVVPFFLEGDAPLQDPAQWPGKSIKMYQWLEARGQSVHTIRRANIALRGFYGYLVDEGEIKTGVDIRLREPVDEDDEDTPLPRLIEPKEVLEFVKAKLAQANNERLDYATRQQQADERAAAKGKKKSPLVRVPNGTGPTYAAVLALLGYFFSLRPQESFALRKMDFTAGSATEPLECCRTMKDRGLYDRLAVNIHRQRSETNKFPPPKKHSKGFVACFHEEAARQLVQLFKGLEPDELILKSSPDWLFELWSRYGIRQNPSDRVADITLKDLRRASIYYLGHHTKLSELVPLMKHARHKKPETTMLYLRRPEEEAGTWQELDLDA